MICMDFLTAEKDSWGGETDYKTPDNRLESPILIKDAVDFTISCLSGVAPTNKRQLAQYPQFSREITLRGLTKNLYIEPDQFTIFIWNDIWDIDSSKNAISRRDLLRAQEAGAAFTRGSVEYLCKILTEDPDIRLSAKDLNTEQSEYFWHKWSSFIGLREILSWMVKTGTGTNVSFAETCRLTSQKNVYLCSLDFTLVYRSDTRLWSILNRDHMLMVLSVAGQRCLVEDSLDKNLVPGLQREAVHKLYSHGDYLIGKYGSKAYRIIKSIESLCVGLIISMETEDNTDSPYLTNMLENVSEKAEMLDATEDTTIWVDLIRDICKTPEIAGELYGLFRIFGHPAIDPYTAGLKIHERAYSPKNILLNSVSLLNAAWSMTLCQGFFKRNGRWPAITNHFCEFLVLKQFLMRQTFPPSHILRHCIKEFGLIKFADQGNQKCLYDLDVYVKDKSISPDSLEELSLII